MKNFNDNAASAWQCGCGNHHFILRTDGKAECTKCMDFAPWKVEKEIPEDTATFVLVPRNRTKEMHDAMFNAMPDKLFLLSDTDALWWAAIKAWMVKP